MYVVRCADGTLYTGYAVDPQARVAVHNSGKGAKYTRSRLPVTLVAVAAFGTKHQAMSAEYRFKRISRQRKELLIREAEGVPFEELLFNAFPGLREGQGSSS